MRFLQRPGFSLGLFGLLAGGGIFLGAGQISSGFGYEAVGPATLPKIVAIGMMLSGGLCLLELRRPAASEQGFAFGHWVPVAVISAALLLAAAFLKTLGWVPMAALVFAAGAIAFGSRAALRDLLIGMGAALVVLLAFSHGLGIRLPEGVLSPILSIMK